MKTLTLILVLAGLLGSSCAHGGRFLQGFSNSYNQSISQQNQAPRRCTHQVAGELIFTNCQ